MTRKDYQMIAAVLMDARDLPADEGLDAVAAYLADELKARNSRFDRKRFLLAAGCIVSA